MTKYKLFKKNVSFYKSLIYNNKNQTIVCIRTGMFNNLKKILNELKNKTGNDIKYCSKKPLIETTVRILNAITKKKRVIVYGDYDVDGIFSSFMLYHFIKSSQNKLHGNSSVDIEFSKRENEFGLTLDEYREFSGKYDLIITTDNGSELKFLEEAAENKNLVVIDHHPTQNEYDFIVNPNVKRGDVSTSGGMVVYDLINKLFLPNLKKFTDIEFNKETLQAYKELTAVTLISDMASLVRHNREFIISVLKNAKKKYYAPAFSLLNDFNALEVSFKIISPVNAYSRMQKDLKDIIALLAPSDYEEFKSIVDRLQKNNKEKIKLVNYYYYEAMEGSNIQNDNVFFYFNPEMPIGLNGLLANKINTVNNKITLIASLNGDKIVGSARGIDAKLFLSMLTEIPTFEYGGHNEACGFKLKKEYLNELNTLINELINYYNFEKPVYKLIDKKPADLSEVAEILAYYKQESGGVGFAERLYYAFKADLSISRHYNSGYAEIRISDGENTLYTIMHTKEFEKLKKKDIFVGELKENGKVNIVTGMDKEEFEKKCVPYINIKNTKGNKNAVDIYPR